MGCVKFEIKKITNIYYLKATFLKRRKGLYGKATDLSHLTGCQIAIIVFSPGSRLFLFGHPSAKTVIDRFLAQQAPCTDDDHEDESFESIHGVDDREDLENNQEEYKQEEDEMNDEKVNFWWDELVAPDYTFVREATSTPATVHYDYIVISEGTAGCPLAATHSHGATVLVLERGSLPYGNPNIINIDNFAPTLLDTSPTSPAQQFTSEDGVYNIQARVLGGSSAASGSTRVPAHITSRSRLEPENGQSVV